MRRMPSVKSKYVRVSYVAHLCCGMIYIACCCCLETEIGEDGKTYIRSHKCSGIQCNDPKCGYVRGHPELRDAIKAKARAEKQAAKAKKTAAKLEQDERQALLAGMKPPTTTNFKTIMEQTFSKHI